MPFKDEICKIVIENIELLEEAPDVIEVVEEKIFKAINKKFESSFKGKVGWKDDGVYTYFDTEGQTTFSSKNWPIDPDGDYPVYYNFERLTGDNSNYFLPILLGKVPTEYYAIFFSVEYREFGMNKSQWKKILIEKYQKEPKLQELGVVYDNDGSLCIPVVLDMQTVANEYPDFDESLEPVDTAIKILMEAHQYIDKIVKELPKMSACG